MLIQIILLHGFHVCISIVRLDRYVIKKRFLAANLNDHGVVAVSFLFTIRPMPLTVNKMC